MWNHDAEKGGKQKRIARLDVFGMFLPLLRAFRRANRHKAKCMRERSAYIAKTLADGQVAASWGAIFAAPNLSEITTLWLYNTGASVQTVDVAITRKGETRRQIARLEIVAGGYATLKEIDLGIGDALSVQSTSATTVNYVVTGWAATMSGVAR